MLQRTFLILALLGTLLACAFASGPSPVQDPAPAPRVGYSYLYDLKSKVSLPVMTYSVGTMHDFLRIKNFNVEALGLGGLNANNQQVTIGFAGAVNFPLAKEVDLKLGLAFRSEALDPFHPNVGLFVGFGFHF